MKNGQQFHDEETVHVRDRVLIHVVVQGAQMAKGVGRIGHVGDGLEAALVSLLHKVEGELEPRDGDLVETGHNALQCIMANEEGDLGGYSNKRTGYHKRIEVSILEEVLADFDEMLNDANAVFDMLSAIKP